jgi:hypothetical protein
MSLLTATLATLGRAEQPAAELVDQLRALENLKSATAAAQARVTALFAAVQRAAQAEAGVPARRVGEGIAAQVALARRDSPHRGGRYLGLAAALTAELPHTMAALEAGQISEWRATLVARETACLSVEHRRQVDAELAAAPGGMGSMGDRTIAAEARRIAYRLDPHGFTDRARRAVADRRVSIRPAPDAMTWLSALLPVTQGVAAYSALARYADAQRAAGDDRGRGQVMADTLVERVTGQTNAADVPIHVGVVMTDRTLFADGDEPAEVDGHGPLPAPLARELLREAQDGQESNGAERARVWLRRLYTTPGHNQLVAMDARARCFDGQLRRFLITADRRCRTPWCDAPIRHLDHAVPAAAGGPTTAANSQGLCEACNYTKQAPSWRTVPHPDRVVETFTPTGHRYKSRPPSPVGWAPTPERASPG